jgi:hypothetical protein
MRGEHRKCPAFAGDNFTLGRVMFGRADHAACKNPVEDSVAGGTRGLPIDPAAGFPAIAAKP